jgi:formylmethanofuran dehydrogenase subunit D
VTAQTQILPTEVSKPTMTVNTNSGATIEQAATLASNVLGNSEVYSAEVTQLNGVDVYLVTFSSGDLVYVSLDGKVVSISKLPVNYVINQTTAHSNGGGNNNSNFNSNSGNSSDTVSPSSSSTGNSGSEDHSSEDHSGGENHGGGDD